MLSRAGCERPAPWGAMEHLYAGFWSEKMGWRRQVFPALHWVVELRWAISSRSGVKVTVLTLWACTCSVPAVRGIQKVQMVSVVFISRVLGQHCGKRVYNLGN